MALTISNFQPGSGGNLRRNIMDITFDSSYATGGESLTPAMLGLVRVDKFNAQEVGGRTFPYDRSTQKLQAYASTTEVANTTDLSAVTVRVEALGI